MSRPTSLARSAPDVPARRPGGGLARARKGEWVRASPLAGADPPRRAAALGDDTDHVTGLVEHELARRRLQQGVDAALEQPFEQSGDEGRPLGPDVLLLPPLAYVLQEFAERRSGRVRSTP